MRGVSPFHSFLYLYYLYLKIFYIGFHEPEVQNVTILFHKKFLIKAQINS
jgi:hypothetical protein